MPARPDAGDEPGEQAPGLPHRPAARSDTWGFRRTYPGIPGQIRKARADVAQLLDGCPAADNVMLCLSELVSNAILHSQSGQPGGHFGVQAQARAGQWVRVTVNDDGGPWAARTADDDIPHGHGLDIVRALSAGMGVSDGSPRRAVWFQCAWDRA
jgi:hypothetical protein